MRRNHYQDTVDDQEARAQTHGLTGGDFIGTILVKFSVNLSTTRPRVCPTPFRRPRPPKSYWLARIRWSIDPPFELEIQ